MTMLVDRYGRAFTEPAPVKAASGPGVAAMLYDPPITTSERNPLAKMRGAQMLYWTHPWIRSAEWAVTRRVAGMAWHLENENEDQIEEGSAYEVLIDPVGTYPRPPQVIRTSRDLIEITSRHVGLCGVSYWYLDKRDPVENMPTGILYVNPARLYPQTDKAGTLLSWVLDPTSISADEVYGGLRLEIEEVLPFYLSIPDWGYMTTGLVEVARLKAQISTLADQHAAYVLASGGRLAGIVSPKEGGIDDEQFKTMTREFRNVSEMPDAAKRTIILQGPIDFTPTAANPNELSLLDLSRLTRDDIFAIWGVPPGAAAIPAPAGLNSGDSRKYDEAQLMQGPVHDRIESIREALQTGLLGRTVGDETIIFEEPTFDDEAPAYELIQKAQPAPLTRNERREIIGKDPLPEYGPDGEALGLAIDLPISLKVVGQGAQESGEFSNAPEPAPEPVVMTAAPVGTPPPAGAAPPVKASLRKPIEMLRRSIDERYIPEIKASVEKVLAAQRDEAAGWIEDHPDHLSRAAKDTGGWWNPVKWDRRLRAAIDPSRLRIAEGVVSRVQSAFSTGKATTMTENIVNRVTRHGARRVTRINETTREQIREAVREGVDQGLTATEIAQLIRDLTGFGEYRAELIARTETMAAYNESALESYTEMGVEMVEPLDGDEDPECQARLARGAVTIDEALADEDHPNGTLDWVPVLDEPAPAKAEVSPYLAPLEFGRALVEALGARDPIVIPPAEINYIPPAPTPIILPEPAPLDLTPFADIIAAGFAGLAEQLRPRRMVKRAERDANGRVIAVIDEWADGP